MSLSKTFNPTPITKLLVTIILSSSIMADISDLSKAFTVIFIAFFFALNNRTKTAIKVLVFYALIILLAESLHKIDINFIKIYILTFVAVIRIFFIPLLAGKFLIDTSDVSSLIVSFEKMRFPKVLVIPLAVIFRYIPAFKDDRKNIKIAMKMRGISFVNPVRYLEYVSIPLFISAINISDDISKAAETKCISNPGPKSRYKEVKLSLADLVYICGIIFFNIVWRFYA